MFTPGEGQSWNEKGGVFVRVLSKQQKAPRVAVRPSLAVRIQCERTLQSLLQVSDDAAPQFGKCLIVPIRLKGQGSSHIKQSSHLFRHRPLQGTWPPIEAVQRGAEERAARFS